MFKKLVIVFVVVNFLFCYNAISSLGVDVPSTIKEDIYLLNYDKEIDTLYLMPSTSHNIYYAFFLNASPNSSFFKIQTDIPLFKSLMGKEIFKDNFSPLFPYTLGKIFFQIPGFNFDQSLGYLIIEIFSLNGEKVKEFNIKKVIITKETSNIALNFPDISYQKGEIQNISKKSTIILINIIQFNQIKFFKTVLSPEEKIKINIVDPKRNEGVLIISSNNWGHFSSQYHVLNKNVTLNQEQPKDKDKEIFWCQDKNNDIYGFLTHENVLTIFCYSVVSISYNINLKIHNNSIVSKDYSIVPGWNKINIFSKRNITEEKVQLEINNINYNIVKIFVENSKESINFDIKFNCKRISYPTSSNNNTKFMVITTKGILYIEYIISDQYHIPTYHRKEKILNIDVDYNEVVIVELTTSLDMIKPTLSE